MDQFIHILDPMFDYIDRGKLFRQPFMWLYYIIGVALCCWLIYYMVESFSAFKYLKGGAVFFGILMEILMLVIAAFSIIYWFKRAPMVNRITNPSERFIAIPAVANLVRCCGEYLGIAIGAAGCYLSLFGAIFLNGNTSFSDFTQYGLAGVLIFPVIGFIIVILSRYISEMMLALASIANDTHELATFNPAN